MDSIFPLLTRRYSTFRSDLPLTVWQRYFTNASSGPVATRSRSQFPMKLICVSQHCFLKAALLMWSSPAALEKVKSSASRISSGPHSFCPQPAYHLRTTSSVDGLALASPGRLTAPTSAQAPVASRFLRDTADLVLVIVGSPLGCGVKRFARPRRLLSAHTDRLVRKSACSLRHRCDQPRLRLPGARKDLSQPTIFLIPAFITFGS